MYKGGKVPPLYPPGHGPRTTADPGPMFLKDGTNLRKESNFDPKKEPIYVKLHFDSLRKLGPNFAQI